jgi:hypothetical protein
VRENVLEGLGTLVTGAMFVAVGILVVLCAFLILRSGAVGSGLRFRRRRKSRAEKEEDDRRRKRIRSFFS